MLKKALIAAALVVGVSGTAMASEWSYLGSDASATKIFVKDLSYSGNYASVKVAFLQTSGEETYGKVAVYCGQPRLVKLCDINGDNCTSQAVASGTNGRFVYDFLCN